MGATLVRAAIEAGVPVLDVVVTFVDGIDFGAATAALNALSEDFHLEPHAHEGVERMRSGTATQHALERMFGCRVERVPTMFYDPAVESMLPDYEQCVWEVGEPTRFPVPDVIAALHCPQPAGFDDGQWVDPARVARDRCTRWELWRQDDGGNSYIIATFSTEWTALAAMRCFEERGHKQVYWVSGVPKPA